MTGTSQESTGAPGRKPRRGDRFEVEVERIDLKGRALGRGRCLDLEGETEWSVSLRNSVPGELVLAEATRRRGNRVEGRVLERLRASEQAVEPRCALFGVCGGCSFQGLAYSSQLEFKRAGVAKVLVDGDVLQASEADRVEAAVGCEDPYHYRNKMEFTFSNRRWVLDDEPESAESDFGLGLHVPGRWDKVLDVPRCEIQSELANPILATLRALALELELAPWDVREHEGLLRHAVLRVAESTNEIMVNLVTSDDAREEIDGLATRLLDAHPEITTLVQNVNTRPASVAIGEREHCLHGPGMIREEIDGLSFLISAASFFQTNSRQAEVLFRIVREQANCQKTDHVFDVYCGTGSLSLNLARDAGSVIGFELVEEAVVDARRNAELNEIENASFVAGDVITTIEEHLENHSKPDLIVVDPPRAGIHPKVLTHLARVEARRIIYVSCNPKSAAADVGGLVMSGYRVTRIQPVDLFPHTPHVETVLTLEFGGEPS